MTDFVKQLKEHLNIADVVGEYVRLRKTGLNHMGLCPFHGERSASFSVAEKKGIYHCFGCQRGGDAISFIQEIQGVSFHEAVRMLAAKAGLKVPPEFASRGKAGPAGQSVDDKLEIYYKLNRFVAQFYHEKLLSPAGKAAREYLQRRGVTEATIKTAYLGYAPAEWAELHDFLAEKKAPMNVAEELGLIRKKNADASGREYYDLFRDRVMFPVVDLRGRVIAFGARALGDSDGPKYLNSTESPIYKKGSHLFGMFFAQKEIRAEDLCVVVEGFMDCLSLQQAGIGYTVATLGTALTQRQVQILKRLTKNIVLLFDGDSAGKEAQARAMETFLDEDVVVKGVSLPEEFDPDEFVRERGPEALTTMLKSAPYILDQRVLEFAAQAGSHSEERARAVDQILPWVAKISSETSRIVRIEELANLFGLKSENLEKRVFELRSQAKTVPGRSAQVGVQAPGVRPSAPAKGPMIPRISPAMTGQARVGLQGLDALDVRLIEQLIQYPHLASEISDKNGILNGLESEAAKGLAEKILATTSPSIDASILDVVDAPALKTVLTRALVAAEQAQAKERSAEEQQSLDQEIRDLEKKLIRRGLERRRENLRAILLKADGSGNPEELKKIMSEYSELAKKLDHQKEAR